MAYGHGFWGPTPILGLVILWKRNRMGGMHPACLVGTSKLVLYHGAYIAHKDTKLSLGKGLYPNVNNY